MPSVAVTVVGRDRPGIVADVTGVIADLGGNLEDSSMTLLRGHFAMTLIADLPAGSADLQARLEHLTADGLTVAVLDVAPETGMSRGRAAVVSVHGADRPGIVHAAAAVIARCGGNITDLDTRLGTDVYVLTADVEFPVGADLDAVAGKLSAAVAPLGVRATLHAVEDDVL